MRSRDALTPAACTIWATGAALTTEQVEIGARFKSAGGALVTFSASAIRDMVAAAAAAKGNETGGVLIGRYSSDLSSAWVEKATAAPPDSEASPTWFIRGRLGLDRLLRRSWSAGSHYLGEWHSHPAYHPSPSSDDLYAIQKIAENQSYRCQRPILAIIGGSFEDSPLLAVTLGNRSGRPERLIDIRNGP